MLTHKPVMQKEVIEQMVQDPDGIYIDATFGRGGHAKAILSQLSEKGRLIAFDRDQDAIDSAKANSDFQDQRFDILHKAFSELQATIEDAGLLGKINGILLDLGVSSPQLDNEERGFSFTRNGPLDMRMDQTSGIAATTWLETVDEQTLAEVLKTYGEERYASRIARAILKARDHAPITTTGRLAEVVAAANPKHEKHKHPATRVFQAIRIFINKELEELEACLTQCLNCLAKGGRLLVISFHSLEDRMVKRFFKSQSKGDAHPRRLPIKDCDLTKRLKCIGRALKPQAQEVQENIRARSATLRIAEKMA